MMDRYTLMCSKLKQLQEEWEPKVGDTCYSPTEKQYYIFGSLGLGYYQDTQKFYWIEEKDYSETLLDKEYYSWLPTLEDLIEMLGEKFRGLDYFYETKIWIAYSVGWFKKDKTHKEALLKLVAYERWGLTWDDEKKDWDEDS
jgi:hypothetical protein